MAQSYYDILGIPPNADKGTIKRAYFSRVKEHPPEKDPEEFQKIREAYEILMSGKGDRGAMTLEFPDTEEARSLVQQIESKMSQRSYEDAAALADMGLKLYGENCEGFLYLSGINLRRSGRTGIAVRRFEQLHRLYPDKSRHCRELAVSYWARGFGKKALSAFREAYEMGERDMDFLYSYFGCCYRREEYDEACAVAAAGVESGIQDPKEHWDEILEILMVGFGMVVAVRKDGGNPAEYSKRMLRCFIELIEKSPRRVRDESDRLKDLVFSWGRGSRLMNQTVDAEEARLQRNLMEAFLSRADESVQKEWKSELFRLQLERAKEDQNLPDYLRAVSMVFPYGYEDVPDVYCKLDVELMMLEDWPKEKQAVDALSRSYRLVYEALEPLVDEVSGAWERNQVDQLRNSLLKRYEPLHLNHFKGFFYDHYPQYRKSSAAVVWRSSQGTVYSGGRKIGRNDPCPCGSGKKYKHCCGRKKG